MTSTDREILIAINDRVERIDNRVSALESTIAEMRQDTERQTLRLSQIETQIYDLKGYINTWFTVIAIVIAIAAAFTSGAGKKDTPQVINLGTPDVNEIARKAADILKSGE